MFRPRVVQRASLLVGLRSLNTVSVPFSKTFLCCLFLLAAGTLLAQGPNVLTWRYDNTHQGQNTQESILTPTNVNTNTFGKLFSHTVDGQVYGQPLYVGDLTLPNQTTHNVIFVATEHDSVYAFDADSNGGANSGPLWQASMISTAHGAASGTTTVPSADVNTQDINPEIGISSTPVIDLNAQTIFVVAKSKENGKYVQRLHALSILDGSERSGSPVSISASVPGVGSGSSGGTLSFSPLWENNRPALGLFNGNIYIAFGSHGDNGPWHGWVLVYNETTLAQTAAMCTSPAFYGSAVWMSGAGLPIDTVSANGRAFLATGNGDLTSYPPLTNNGDYGESILRYDLSNGGFVISDAFTAFNLSSLNGSDVDQGSGGVLILPDQPGAHPHELVQVGKEGRILVLNRDDLGGYAGPSAPRNTNILQDITNALKSDSGLWSTPAYWNENVYMWAENDSLKMFPLTNGALSNRATAESSTTSLFPGASPVVSSNGTQNGIVWALETDRYKSNGSSILFAFNATNVSQELYSSNQNASRDDAGPAVKFAVPVITNGKVYVGAGGQVDVYGLLNEAQEAPTTTSLTAPGNATYGTNVTLTATVSSTSGIPAGAVTFLNGATSLGTASLNAGGVAALSTSALPGGSDTVTAVYAGTTNFDESTSTVSSVTVSAATQTITFAAVAARAYGSAPFAVSATSSAGSGYPVTITVQSGPAVISGGIVTLKGAGTVVLQAAQAGNSNYTAASATQTFQVTPAALTVTANDAGRAYKGANPAFSGSITGAVGSDSFSETFATSATTNSNVGSYAIVPSVSSAQMANYSITYVNGTLSVTAAPTTTSLNTLGSASPGASVTLTATVASSAGVPAGAVTFRSGATLLGSGTLNGGTAVLTTTTLAAGTDSVTAVYTGNGNFAGSTSAASTITVGASQTIFFSTIASRTYGSAPFTVSASSSLGSNYPVSISVQSGPAAINGGMVTLTGVGTVVLEATRAASAQYASATATESFQVLPALLTVAANNATRAYGAANPGFSGTVTGAVGSDTFSPSFTTAATAASNVGSYPIVPAVSGAQLANYTVSATNGALTVTAAATTTALSAPGSAASGASVPLAATVTSTAGIPLGTVTFYNGSTPLGTAALTGGVASFSTTSLPTGSNAITADYNAGGNFAASSSTPTALMINAASQAIAFAAIASRTYGSPAFAVTASSSLGSAYPVTIGVLSGPAAVTGGMVSLTGVGTVMLQAMQAGDSRYAPATAVQAFQVMPAALTVIAGNASRTYGAVNPVFTGTVTGAVGNDRFSESFTTAATAASNAGSYAIVPSVSGARLANYTVTATNGTLTVSPATTSVALSAPANAAFGTNVTLTATVASSAGTPGGSVSFSLGSTLLGSGTLNAGGVATLNTASLPAGSDTITATYAATGNYAGGSSPAVSLTVNAAPIDAAGSYTVAASPTALNLAGIATAKTLLTFTPTGGYSGTIALTCTNLPANASCQFAQNQITLRGDNQPVTLGLTIQSTKPLAKLQGGASTSALLALTFWWPGSLAGVAWFLRKGRPSHAPRVWQLGLLLLCAGLLAAGVSGCGGSGVFTTSTTTSQVTVVATGTSGNTVTTQNLVLNLKMTE